MSENKDTQILSLLNRRIEQDIHSNKCQKPVLPTDALESFGQMMLKKGSSVSGLMEKVESIRTQVSNMFEYAHYPSYGIARPSHSTRAAELVEQLWLLRRWLLEEANRPGKGPQESHMVTGLIARASAVDQQLYQAGSDDAMARSIELAQLRPLALEIRRYTFLRYATLARPVWQTVDASVDTNTVFYSGRTMPMQVLSRVCSQLGLSQLKAPKSSGVAQARWQLIQKAGLTVFDMGADKGADQALVAYELGIALTLGKPIVVITTGKSLPFDIDIEPVELPDDDGAAEQLLTSAINKVLVAVNTRGNVDPLGSTLKHILKSYPLPQKNIYLDQSLKQIQPLGNKPDSVATDFVLKTLVGAVKGDSTVLIHPSWPPSYGDGSKKLLHLMPLRLDKQNAVVKIARQSCDKAGIDYIRSDEVSEPYVSLSVWNEICRASCIMVDLTGFDASVALALGMSHTLGKPTLITADQSTVDNLFAMNTGMRVSAYDVSSDSPLTHAVDQFLLTI